MWTLVGDGVTGMRFTHQHEGKVVATEVIHFSG
jgi:hypothetical protein